MSALIALLFYLATAVLLAGLAWRVYLYARTPAPLRIPTTPAPTTRGGAAMRVAREVVLFQSLFRANKWTWLLGWAFHVALLLVLLRHLRYFTEPVWSWVVWIQPFGLYAGFVMVAALIGLWIRRVGVARIKAITGPSDHLMLALLVAIGLSGLGMKYLQPTDITGVKAYMLGLMRFDWQPLPGEPLLILHLLLVALLMIIFPFSKLLHAPGVFFSPTRNQPDNPRERRHLAPWAAAQERGTASTQPAREEVQS